MATVDTQLTSSTRTHEAKTLPHVLLLVDDPSKTTALEIALRRENFDLTVVTTIAEAMTAMTAHSPQIVITESADAGALVPLVRTFGHNDSVSLIVISAEGRVEAQFGGEIVVDQKTAARDVAQLARIELMCRSTRQLDFGVGGARPEWVLRAMLSTGRSGRLVLQHEAEITFDSGSVVSMKVGAVTTVDTMAHALALSEECSLRLEPVLEPGGRLATAKEFADLVMPRVARFRAALQHAVALDARLGVDFARLAEALPSMPDDVNRVVRLFDGHRLMRNVIVDSPFEESLTLEIATRLAERGIIKPVSVSAAKHAVAPKLFDPDSIKLGNEAAPTVEPIKLEQFAQMTTELEHHLEAFKVKPVVEAAEPTASRPVRQYAEGLEQHDEHQMEQALQNAAEAHLVDGATEFERAITPIMTPAVEVKPETATHTTDDLEASFFAQTEHAPAVVENVTEQVDAVAEKTEKEHEAHSIHWSVYALGAVGALVLAIFAERLISAGETPVVPAEVAPVAAPVAEAPRAIEVAAPVVVEVATPEATQELAEATALYKQGDYPSAIFKLEQLVKANPASVQGWLLLGLARYDANDNIGAREAADTVMKLDPKNARVQMLEATLQFDAKNKEKAQAALHRYLELEPNGQFAQEAEALLKR